jgi:cell division protein FtsQ
MSNRIKNIISFSLLTALFVLVSFTKNEQGKRLVKKVNIFFDATKGDPFMERDDVIDLVYSRYDTLVGKPVDKLELGEIENLLRNQNTVKDVEVYVKQNGNINIEIELRKMIVRVKPDSLPGFYIDNEGRTMEWSSKYSPRVMTVTGNLNLYNRYLKDTAIENDLTTHTKLINDIYSFAKYVNSSSFWKAQIGQIYINQNGDAIIVPLIGSEEFVFGELTDSQNKFFKIRKYYKEIAPKMGWNQYKEVNVKFEKQIVCK